MHVYLRVLEDEFGFAGRNLRGQTQLLPITGSWRASPAARVQGHQSTKSKITAPHPNWIRKRVPRGNLAGRE